MGRPGSRNAQNRPGCHAPPHSGAERHPTQGHGGGNKLGPGTGLTEGCPLCAQGSQSQRTSHRGSRSDPWLLRNLTPGCEGTERQRADPESSPDRPWPPQLRRRSPPRPSSLLQAGTLSPQVGEAGHVLVQGRSQDVLAVGRELHKGHRGVVVICVETERLTRGPWASAPGRKGNTRLS